MNDGLHEGQELMSHLSDSSQYGMHDAHRWELAVLLGF